MFVNLSAPFINRPVATTLLAIGLALAGILAFNFLPISSLPQVEFPTIMVQANLSGASPENMSNSVVTPLERALSRISGISDMTSQSSLGNARIIIQFNLDKEVNSAAREVQSAINASMSSLPSSMLTPPTYRKVNPADPPIILFALTSKHQAIEKLYDLASTTLQQRLLKVEGVGQVMVVGSSLPAVRIELNPMKMNQYNISISDLSTIINASNINMPKGQIEDNNRIYQIITNDQLFKAAEYGNLIIHKNQESIIRLKDIATVTDSVQDVRNSGFVNDDKAVLLVVFKSPGANVIETNKKLQKAFFDFKTSVPSDVEMHLVMDRSTTINAALHEVKKSLVVAMIFVLIVVYFFLGNIRSTIIPGIAMALSLLGTFAVMWLLGFSLNILSMMALTIATGFVVDDAIVVLENISRYIEEGMDAKQAAFKGAAEIGFTVTAISISLIAVFIPILLMGGLVGRLFKEFAVTLSVAILISLLVSITLTPMMCAYTLKHELAKESAITKAMKSFYAKTLAWALDHPRIMMLVTVFAIILNIYLFAIAPKGFFPQQDTGRIIANLTTDQKGSFNYLNNKLVEYIKIIRQDKAVSHAVGYISSGNTNNATIFIILTELEKRKISADQVITRLRNNLSNISGATLYMQSAQDLVIGGRQSKSQFQYTVSGDSLEEVNRYAPIIMEEIKKVPGIIDINSDQSSSALQILIKINYNKATPLGITAKDIDNALYQAFGQSSVSTIYHDMNQYYVIMEFDSNYVKSPKALEHIYIKSSSNFLVPLSSFASFDSSAALLSVNHQGLSPCATLSFNLMENVHLGDAVEMVNKQLSNIALPITIGGAFKGSAQAFQESLSSQPLLILASIVAVYFILGMLYESLIHPITILSTLPSAGVGAILALIIFNIDLTIIAMIGIILLIGIVKKNAIMMIDFVLEISKTQKIDPRQAIYQAAILRFRPIMMTSISALLGALPMALGRGLGAEIYVPLGVSIIGGLIVSQMITLYTVPVIYLKIEKLSNS
jgi:multidrug efflux pump